MKDSQCLISKKIFLALTVDNVAITLTH